jgi:hypothetical protein
MSLPSKHLSLGLAALATLALVAPTAHAQADRQYSSSYKRDSRLPDNTFSYSSAMDSNKETSWQVDPEKDNLKQWIEIDIPAAKVDKLGVVIGWDKSEDTFKDYARLKAAKVEVFEKINASERKQLGTSEVTFEDKRGWQIVELDNLQVGEYGGIVRINVTEVYPGIDFTNLAVSEVRVHLEEFPAETVQLNNVPKSADEANHDGSMAVDGNDRTYFVAEGKTAEIAIEAPGYGVATVGLTPGPATHARPKTVKVKSSVLAQEEVHEIPEDAKGQQWLLIPIVKGYTGGAWGEVVIEVTDTWPGSKPDAPLAIAELRMNAATIEEF